jgi:hypothetical protein
MLTVQQVKRKAERKRSVIVINDIERSVFKVEFIYASCSFHTYILSFWYVKTCGSDFHTAGERSITYRKADPICMPSEKIDEN